MVKADDKINPSEIKFIHKLAKRMDITNEDVIALFKNPQPSQPVYSEVDRITHFYKLILVMNVDNETHEKELIALKNFGLKMGVHSIVAEQILKKANQFENKIIPSEELLKIFKIYYN